MWPEQIPLSYTWRNLKARGLTTALAATGTVHAQSAEPGTAASKVALRGEAYGVKVAEIRLVRRGDVLVVQADIQNAEANNRQVYYRFRWLDGSGMQVGDGEAWKPLLVLGQQSIPVKGVAPTSAVVDFRIEMNVEKL